MSDKIHCEHLERTAYVYVRQSSNHQVREHLEGQGRQYALAQRARQLGFQRVTVIDRIWVGPAPACKTARGSLNC